MASRSGCRGFLSSAVTPRRRSASLASSGDINGPDNAPVDIQGGAVAIGGQIRYVFPGSTPFAVLGEVFYAPEVTSISEWDRLLEYRLALELEVTPSARAYIGYRMLEVEFDTFGTSVDYEVDDSANIGVRFEF